MAEYYYSALSNACEPCTGAWGNTLFVAVGVLLALGVAALLATGHLPIPTALTSSSLVGLFSKLDSGSLKVIFSTYQIVQSITVTLDVEFPPLFTNFLSLLSVFSFNVSTLECSVWGQVYNSVYLTSAAPLVCAAIIVLVG